MKNDIDSLIKFIDKEIDEKRNNIVNEAGVKETVELIKKGTF